VISRPQKGGIPRFSVCSEQHRATLARWHASPRSLWLHDAETCWGSYEKTEIILARYIKNLQYVSGDGNILRRSPVPVSEGVQGHAGRKRYGR
jgi:hypothetical protein